jgi:hypothetical protein
MGTTIRRDVCALGAVLALLAGPGGARAGESTLAVARPGAESDGSGIPLGGFLLFPSFTFTTSFDDNIRRTDSNAISDTIFALSPVLALRSRWSQHALNLTASSDTLLYAKHPRENITPFNFAADGRLDVLRSLRILGEANFSQLYELRSSPELPTDAAEPLPYSRSHADVSVEYQPALLGVAVGIGFDRLRYGSVEILGAEDISWKDQNRDIVTPHARVFYEFLPRYQAYIEGIYETRDFELDFDRYGFHRSSHGYRVRGGLQALLGNLIQGEVFVGYLDQQYDAPLEDVGGLDFGATLDWSVTPLTTLHLLAARTVNDTTFAGVSGIDDQTIGLSVDHDLLRNLVLRARIAYTDSQYRGQSRKDGLTDAGLGVDYLLNQFMSVSARYTYQLRSSSDTGQGYSDNLFSVGITARL